MKKIKRCEWTGNDELMIKYHDEEWGVPVEDDKKVFEFIILESSQAGLSWKTILHKREDYREAFSNFDFDKVSRYTSKDIKKLLKNSKIIRNKLKITSTISNAKKFIELRKEFGSFRNYLDTFAKFPIINKIKNVKNIPTKTELSDRISADLKKRGFKFMGSTIFYAHMQATGMVDDHVNHCFRKGKRK